jgi:hydroxymethylglutaryl-CoA reductase
MFEPQKDYFHKTSRIPGFYKMSQDQRLARLGEATGCAAEDARVLRGGEAGLPLATADRMIENCVGVFGLPVGVGMNLRVNGRDVMVPMVVEEPSVVAGMSHGAKFLREGRGIETTATPPVMIGQLQVLDVPDPDAAVRAVIEDRHALIDAANAMDPGLLAAGGGARDIEAHVLPPMDHDDPLGTMVVVHLLVDVRDAMGANAINTMVEHLAHRVEQLTGGRVRLRILSNLADRRLITARGQASFATLGDGDEARGRDVAEGVQEASVFAERDPYRAATHNKGIMNGIDAFLVATGQDWRAVEAGAHAYAARGGRYTALARWRVRDGALSGEITLPMAVGTVGGAVRTHPASSFAVRRLLRIDHADELGQLAAAVGLAQNLAALRALAGEGIQRGHMGLHARNVAASAGAQGAEIDALAALLVHRKRFDLATARETLKELRTRSVAA